jgi:hypothetical protein
MLVGFEVIRIKIAPAETKFGKFYPERELYPPSAKNSSDWVDVAWFPHGLAEPRMKPVLLTPQPCQSVRTRTDPLAVRRPDTREIRLPFRS